jgi:endonuclease III
MENGRSVPHRGVTGSGSKHREGTALEDRDIHAVMKIFAAEAKKFAVPIVTEISSTHRDPFHVLVSTILSLRTKDETTREASRRLLEKAPTPESLLVLPEQAVQRLIYPVGFYKSKSKVLRGIARDLLDHHGGRVPDQLDELLKFKGVGRKTANLVLTRGYAKPGICVDTHVHRISNRMGYVATRTPLETEFALRDKLPSKYWIVYNDYLVAYGQNRCKPVSPLCSQCPLGPYCEKRGVGRHR